MNKLICFAGGVLLGLTLISVSRAAIPKRATPGVSEIQANKAATPNFEQDYQHLTSVESKYAESWDQQQRLRKATQRVATRSYAAPVAKPAVKKKKQ